MKKIFSFLILLILGFSFIGGDVLALGTSCYDICHATFNCDESTCDTGYGACIDACDNDDVTDPDHPYHITPTPEPTSIQTPTIIPTHGQTGGGGGQQPQDNYECYNDNECGNLGICKNHKCKTVECKKDADCDNGDVCASYKCIKPNEKCEGSADVGNTKCLENGKIMECATKQQPPTAIECVATSGITCKSKTVYYWDEIDQCEYGCYSEQDQNGDLKVECYGQEDGKCLKNEQCADNEICDEDSKECKQVECKKNADCYESHGQGFICQENECIDNLACNFNNTTITRCKDNTLQECISYESGTKNPKTKYKWDDKEDCPNICVDRAAGAVAKCGESQNINSKPQAKIKSIDSIFIITDSQINPPDGFMYDLANLDPAFDPDTFEYTLSVDQDFEDAEVIAVPDGSARLDGNNVDDVFDLDTNTQEDTGDFNGDEIDDRRLIKKYILSNDKYETTTYTLNFIYQSGSTTTNSTPRTQNNVAYVYTNHGDYATSKASYDIDGVNYYNRVFNNGLHYTNSQLSNKDGSAQELVFNLDGSVEVKPFAKTSGQIEEVPSNYVLTFEKKASTPNNPNNIVLSQFSHDLSGYKLEATLGNGAEIRVYEPVNGLVAYKAISGQSSSSQQGSATVVNNTCRKDADCLLVMDHCSCQNRCMSQTFAKSYVDCDRDCDKFAQIDGQINSCACVNGVCQMNTTPLVAPTMGHW